MSESKSNKGFPETEELVEFIEVHLSGTASDAEYSFSAEFYGHAYARVCLRLLKKCRITPDIAVLAAKLYLMYLKKPEAAIIFLNRRMRIKDIRTFAKGYRMKLSEFSAEIFNLCTEYKVKRCILIYNFKYKTSFLSEVQDIDKLYNSLAEVGITLTDAVRFSDGDTTAIIRSINRKGYD